MKLAAMCLLLTLTACATRPEVTGGEAGGITNVAFSNEREVFAAAQAHCAKYSRNARITQVQPLGGAVSFDCVR